jgi:hypothetical protein
MSKKEKKLTVEEWVQTTADMGYMLVPKETKQVHKKEIYSIIEIAFFIIFGCGFLACFIAATYGAFFHNCGVNFTS